MSFRAFSASFLLLVTQASAGTPPPFTLETALASIAKQYPQARRVGEELPAGVEARENLTYCARPTGDLKLDLYRPVDGKNYPAVLLIHGGGWLAGDRTMERSFAKRLAARG